MYLSYVGGKSHIGKWIVTFIPADIQIYLEPFSGMLGVYGNMDLNKYPKLREVIYNDVNPLNCLFYAAVKKPHDFYKVLKKIPAQKSMGKNPEIKKLFDEWHPQVFCPANEHGKLKVDVDNPDFELAAKYAFILSQCFSGSSPDKGSFVDTGHARSKFDVFRSKLLDPAYQRYAAKITQIRNQDFAEVIGEFDGPKTYLSCDPPYAQHEKLYSNHNFDTAAHERLANTLKICQARWNLSYYDFKELHNWFPEPKYHWERKDFPKVSSAAAKKTMAEELLILNYNPAKQTKLGEFFSDES